MDSRIREGPFIKGVVEVPRLEGHRGPYFMARCIIDGKKCYVTVSLGERVWQEADFPEEGIEVLIWDIRSKPAGWRAYKAKFFRPGDKKLLSNEEVSQ